VTVTDTIGHFFQPGSNTSTRTAVGQRVPFTWLELGSVAAGLQPQPVNTFDASVYISVLNRELARQFHGTADANLDLLSYQGIAAADVSLDRMATAAG